jgi:hypothetical protein
MAMYGPSQNGLSSALMSNPRYNRGYALYQAGANTSPINHWTQGLARLVQAGVGSWQMDKAEKEEEGKRKERAQRLATALQKMQSGDMGGAVADFASSEDDGGTAMQLAMYGQQRGDRLKDTAEDRAWRQQMDERNHQQQRQLAAENRASQPGPAPVAVYDSQTGKVGFVDARELRANPGRYAPPDQGKPQLPFSGNSMDAQTMNILLAGDPASPAYQAAYAHAAQPKMQMNPDGTWTSVTPDMRHFRPPAGAQGQPQPQGAPQAPPMPGGNMPAPVPPQPASPSAQAPQASPMPQAPQMPPQAIGQPTIGAPQGQARLGQAEAAKLRSAQVEAQTLIGALDDFTGTVSGTNLGQRVATALGSTDPASATLNTQWSKAALLAKGESLFNLGVLNGPDLEIIRRTLTDPSTLRGGLTGPAAYKAQAEEIKKLIVQRLNAFEQKAGLPPSQFGAQQPPAPPPQEPQAGGAPVQVQSQEQFATLPSGTQFIAPDGSLRVKP